MQPSSTPADARPHSLRGPWMLLLAATAVPISLFWDFSWESTVGIDQFWSPPHAFNYAAMALAAVGAMALGSGAGGAAMPGNDLIRLGRFAAPLGGWLVLWSALAFVTAVLFDRWWQSTYGLEAGIWHPPQILKAIAFFVTLVGVWMVTATAPIESAGKDVAGPVLFVVVGGLLVSMVQIVSLTQSYPNRQHSASFYQMACGSYPIVLVALARFGRLKWAATSGAAVYLLLVGSMVWLLPLQPARPMTGPIYNALDHLMPPPFPLLLIVPAVAMDLLLRKVRWPEWRGVTWLQSGALGLAFFILFLSAEWAFAGFQLSPSANNWFFAGGGRHWPFFLKISPPARVAFWESGSDVLDGINALRVLGTSILAARLGLWLGAWLKRLR